MKRREDLGEWIDPYVSLEMKETTMPQWPKFWELLLESRLEFAPGREAEGQDACTEYSRFICVPFVVSWKSLIFIHLSSGSLLCACLLWRRQMTTRNFTE